MAEIEFEAVLKFLRENGLSECESALMEDVMEKSQQGSSDFAKFFFPMVPPPPPLRIPPTRRPPPHEFTDGGGDRSSKGSSDDEFVSLGSSTAELCFSGADFTNPYGIGASQPASQSSSDRLSQFGTARDYPDFDLQNDLFWYKENDEDYAMPPFFGDRDFDADPSEDKFVMTVRTGVPVEHELKYSLISEESTNFLENGRALASRDDLKYEPCKDYYELDEKFQLEKCDKKCEEYCNGYSCSVPLCACCSSVGRIYEGDPANYNLENLKVMDLHDYQSGPLGEEHTIIETNVSNQRSSTSDCNGGFSSTHDSSNFKKDCQLKEDNNVDFMDDEVIADETHDAEASIDEEDGAIPDELMIYGNKGDNYEIFNLRIIHRKNRTGFEENKELPIVLNSVIAGRYCVTEFLGSAAFSRVVQAHDLYSGMDVCLKIIKNDKDFFDQSLDEIKLLKFVNKHDPADEHHILRLYDYFYHQEHLFIVTELLRANLYEFQKYNQESGGEPYFTLHRLQVITQQCLEAVLYLHDLGIIHCDLKPENILIKSYRRCEIKVIDLGSSCFQTDNLSLYVQSRSYRAPEVMLGLPYDQKIDLWSIGCILAELYSGEVLFPNEAVVMLLARMIGLLGPIDMDMLQKGQETHKYFTKEYDLYYINEEANQLEYVIPEESSLEHHLQISDPEFLDFLRYLLEINPERRPTAREALQHPWLSHSYDV
ncbi:dual specificity tyrosine-phosphorylation-regulated kinase 2 isoform X1 [Sesamum indicum]|uniref:Dual specificity tyrosine-phosphorylation-regulated kinase 2 isoform X1 n=3 Tax=Sesamum indicum TaxID=4182 RepID=A0A6I9SZZ5_SESIN|nr:dual specificity tyrosine-phosphorylation-regulated kinase 2 isoform X1 [Sesamum indicum]